MERPPTLTELQRWLRSRFTGAAPAGPDWTEVVADQPPIPRAERLAIYRNAIHWRLLDVLSDDFEATGRSVAWRWGFERWDAIARAFLAAHPSRSEDLGCLGEPFAGFLESRPEAVELPFLTSLARLEWRLGQSFLAPDASALCAQRLSLLAESGGAGVRFTLAPSFGLYAAEWPILGVWRRRKSPSDPRFPTSPRRQWLRLGRAADGGCRLVSEPEGAHRILARLQMGETLDGACRDADDAARVGAWFRSWMADGVFTDLRLDQ